MTTETETPAETTDEVIAPSDKRYRGKHLFFALVIFVVGFWFMYDGFVAWPNHNSEVKSVEDGIERAEATKNFKQLDELKGKLAGMHKAYTPFDLFIQRALGFGLPVIGVMYGVWTMYATRGQYRMSTRTVYVPGADGIELSDIYRVDKTRWDRKGIAIVHYHAHHPLREKTFRLDDFAYERDPTGEILKRIDAYLAPPAEMPIQPKMRDEEEAQP